MATESETTTGLSGHMRGVTVTTIACLAGVAAALASGAVVGTGAAGATSRLSIGILLAFIVVEFPLFHVLGVDVSSFGPKDHLYVAFMTFTLWFITFTILLTTGVAL